MRKHDEEEQITELKIIVARLGMSYPRPSDHS